MRMRRKRFGLVCLIAVFTTAADAADPERVDAITEWLSSTPGTYIMASRRVEWNCWLHDTAGPPSVTLITSDRPGSATVQFQGFEHFPAVYHIDDNLNQFWEWPRVRISDAASDDINTDRITVQTEHFRIDYQQRGFYSRSIKGMIGDIFEETMATEYNLQSLQYKAYKCRADE